MAERFELSDEASGGPVGILSGEVVAAGFVVQLAVAGHVQAAVRIECPTAVIALAAQPGVLGLEVFIPRGWRSRPSRLG